MVKFLVDSYGTAEINSAIGQLRRRLTYLKPVLDDIGLVHLLNTRKRIETQTDPKGRVWKHNTKTTRMYKEIGLPMKGGRGRLPAVMGQNFRGVWTGKMMESLNWRTAGNTVIVYVKKSEVPYATTFHFGAKKGTLDGAGRSPWKDIPPRPLFGSNKKTDEQVMTILGNYLLGNQVAKTIGFKS